MSGRDYPRAYALLEQSLYGVDPLPPHSPSPQLSEDRSWLSTPSPNVAETPKFSDSAPKNHDLAFPPTPPTVARSETVETSLANGHARASEPALGTPPNVNSLPTPEVTPPHESNHLAPLQSYKASGTFLSPSLNASFSSPDSFRTAQEDRAANGAMNDQSSEWSSSNKFDAMGDIGLEEPVSPREDDFELNVPAHTLRHKPSLEELDCAMENDLHHGEDDWDAERMKNVSLRRKRPEQKLKDAELESIPILMRGLSMKDHANETNGVVRTPSPIDEDVDAGSPAPLSQGASPRAVESNSKRFSSTSGSSTIVEAVVIDSPPQRKRKLRHASKNLALRDEASTPGASRPNTASSEDPPLYRLLKTDYQPSEPRDRDSFGSDASHGLVIHPLRRRKESLSSRFNALQDDEESPRIDGIQSGLRPLLPLQMYSGRSVSEPIRSKAPLAAAAAEATASLVSPHRARFASSELYGSLSNGFGSLNHQLLREIDEVSQNASSDLVQYEDAREVPKSSANHSVDKFDGPSSHIAQPMMSPRSFKSEVSGPPEVNEAKAINIYPHNNNSLVMVQHATPEAATRQEQNTTISPSLAIAYGGQAYISLEPSTPPCIENNASFVDSPLRNPRNPPEPPVVAVIPPTPARELEEQESPVRKARASSAPPSRRSSLMKRAFLQPLATLAAGNTNGSSRMSTRNQFPRGGKSRSAIRTPAVSEPSQLDSNLHPFWQPRRFWNDLSDSEDEDAGVEDGGDRLPEGGDTRDEMEQQGDSAKWRRGGSLRGFLIGNSLGIQRGPTNRRRHVVNLNRHVSVRASARRSGTGNDRPDKPGFVETLRRRMRDWNLDREEEKRNNRREKLRRSIGPRFYVLHPNKPTTS